MEVFSRSIFFIMPAPFRRASISMPTAAALISPAADRTEYLPPTEAGRSITLHPELPANERNMPFSGSVITSMSSSALPLSMVISFLNHRNWDMVSAVAPDLLTPTSATLPPFTSSHMARAFVGSGLSARWNLGFAPPRL